MPILPSMPQKTDYRLALPKYFLLTYLPLLLILLVIAGTLYTTDYQARRRTFGQQESINITQQHKVIANDIRAIVADLQVIADHYHLHAEQEHSQHSGLTTVADELRLFARHKKIYDQIRFLDENGMEKIRINYNAGSPSIVPPEDLQNKSKRYYFQDTISLKPGEVFVSPLDLNIEQNAIEQPFKPMIRFGAPVFTLDGRSFGIVMLNYLAQGILDDLGGGKENGAARIMLVNREGYWLKSPSPEDEWGFMFPEKKELTFARRFPRAWQKIASNDSGQFIEDAGMFTYATIRPLSEGLLSSTGSPEAFAASSKRLAANEYEWKIVSFIPTAELPRHLEPYRTAALLILLVLALMLGLSCWIAAESRVKRALAELKLKEMASHDTLTGLPNRKLLLDRLTQALTRAKRGNTRMAILFLDLDHFKEINDTLGHSAGDLVLQTTAKRMTERLREEDTVARMGGDEFVIIIQDLQDENGAAAIAEKLSSTIQEPICLETGGASLTRVVGVSIGISIFPEDGDEAGILISKADNAMYQNKQAGRNRTATD